MSLRAAATLLVFVSLCAASASARAQDESESDASSGAAESSVDHADSEDGEERDDTERRERELTFEARATSEPESSRGRAVARVSAEEMDERLSRSSPDAISWIPGVSIQQTTHGQASPYIRGLTGQQVLTLFDGIRLNNGLYRQGPNQYFFTVDADSIDHIDVVRGSASTLWGSDALGGAILASPVEPRLDGARGGLTFGGRALGRFASQDLDLGGRGQLEAQVGHDFAILVGGGYRAAQALQTAGPITNADGSQTLIPFIEVDGRTQRGTGFRYGSFDGRAVLRVSSELRLVAALYGFRQYDSPRADQCPAPFAPERDCLTFTEQFRTLSYVSLRGRAGRVFDDVDVTLSYQRQHELRTLDRPLERVRNAFADDLDTLGLSVRLRTAPLSIARVVELALRVGADAYMDEVHSTATIELRDASLVRALPRGQYTDGARYAQVGAFAESEARIPELGLVLRGGARYSHVRARAAPQAESDTRAVSGDWDALVGRFGATWRALPELEIVANVDQGFRAPNLDDLTSRQQTGPGFQFENPDLGPEYSTTYEVGTRVRTEFVRVDTWVYGISIEDGIVRARRDASACPPAVPGCAASWSQVQLVNAQGTAWILGAELGLTVLTPIGLEAASTISAAWGEGPNVTSADPNERTPLSRIPPPNGTVEVRYRHAPFGLTFAAAMRWAAPQDRLAPSDLSDARIPFGGTPAWALFDLRASWRFERYLAAHVAFENVFDQPYRVHGSGVNGPGRGLSVRLSAEF